ncbi:cutinase family protein [Hoyosella sp. YIM 151337]|uniref:cutinase family protein n=1 Tax=Hoyosella sp. YIM 151337 TaxID=2992742 RepID=UPI0022364CC2|nr:cutinase family protein [Hoyosella sp. YIM 151337]MCW4356146.1 cutinase family protein [Hoyosella sp. YIM 151337]
MSGSIPGVPDAGVGEGSEMYLLRRVSAAGVAAVAAAAVSAVPAHATPDWRDQLVDSCPALYVLAMQGTGQSSPNAPVKTDTGALSEVLSPFLDRTRQAGVKVDRAYVPYPAGFGSMVPGGPEPYIESVAKGVENLRSAAERVLAECPQTKLAAVGYSQGGHVASRFLSEIGAGASSIPASSVAAGAVLGSPTRGAGAGPFPGTQAVSPAPVPGTAGEAVRSLPEPSYVAPEGAGIGPDEDIALDYGQLTGRVAEFCTPGDLACDAPVKAPIARAVVQVAGQTAIGGDPIVALETIGRSLSESAFAVAVDTLNEDIQVPGNALENLSIEPRKTISERVAEATAPNASIPSPDDALAALTKVGLVAASAVISVAQKVITPDTIAQMAAVGLSHPPAAFAVLAAKVADAVVEVIPPATVSRVVQQTFDIVSAELEANEDLFDLQALSTYARNPAAHGSYGSVPITASGWSPTKFVAEWLTAAASDIAAQGEGKQASSASAATTAVTPSPARDTPPSSLPPVVSSGTTVPVSPSSSAPPGRLPIGAAQAAVPDEQDTQS